MNRWGLITALGVCLSACSTVHDRAAGSDVAGGMEAGAAPPTRTGEDGRGEMSVQDADGALTLLFDKAGNWTSMTATGTAAMTEDSPAARESALAIASLRAKRVLVDYLKNPVSSTTTLTRIARAYAKSVSAAAVRDYPSDKEREGLSGMADADLDAVDSNEAGQIATTLREQIRASSSGMLRGVYVSSRAVEGERALVRLTVSRASIAAARNVSHLMGGASQ